MVLTEKKAQIWISVVIYTLVGLTAIGLLLVAIQPRIKQIRDGITIKQTIEALHNFDSALRSTLIAPGNKRNVEFKLSEGQLEFLPGEDKIVWRMQSENKFSEPDVSSKEGTVEILTTTGDPWEVTLTLSYDDATVDLTFSNAQQAKTIPKAAKPYTLSIENLGSQVGAPQQVDIRLLS